MGKFRRHTALLPGALSLLFAATIALSAAPAPRTIASEERAAEALIADRIAAERARLAPGLPPLARDVALDAIARERSEAMAHGAPFDHQDEQGRFAVVDKVQERISRFGAIGENIAKAWNPSGSLDPQEFAKRFVDDWMRSEAHRENILSPAFDHSGIGVAIDGSYAYATQVFWGPPKRINLGEPPHS